MMSKSITCVIFLLCFTTCILKGESQDMLNSSIINSPVLDTSQSNNELYQRVDSLFRGSISTFHQNQKLIHNNYVYLIDETTSRKIENVFLILNEEIKKYKEEKIIEAKAYLFWPFLALISIIGLLICVHNIERGPPWIISLFALLLIASILCTGFFLSDLLILLNKSDISILNLLSK